MEFVLRFNVVIICIASTVTHWLERMIASQYLQSSYQVY
jgi:hypothetical protein